MDFDTGDLIDDRFEVKGNCNDSGGMGQILFVEDTSGVLKGTLALKYCKELGNEYVKRFKREVRLLESFSGNSKVVKTLYSNRKHDPPYFVMEYYSEGDLTSIVDGIINDLAQQERIFNQMIVCISELHASGVFHRDIKPQNFLLKDGNIVVSDFGLGMEPESSSRFTSSSMFWGTQGYLPPEFHSGGFKYADATSDIFMLGKSFYVLLTKQNPTYLMDGLVHPALFHVIERACELDKNKRYQTLPELKQALQMAYDSIMGRGGSLGEVNILISTINDRLENEKKYSSAQVKEFINKLSLVDPDDQIRICLELKRPFFTILNNDKLSSELKSFLKSYKKMIESDQYGWSFAENIADNMRVVFSSPNLDNKVRARCLELAVDAAIRMNRFAAMDTCVAMITSVADDKLGVHVGAIIQKYKDSFLFNIELSQCKCESIRASIRVIQQ
ncbi:MAG: protein kinase [Desulforhopalus sp.]